MAVAVSAAACIALPAVTHALGAPSDVAQTLQQTRDALGATALLRGGVLWRGTFYSLKELRNHAGPFW